MLTLLFVCSIISGVILNNGQNTRNQQFALERRLSTYEKT